MCENLHEDNINHIVPFLGYLLRLKGGDRVCLCVYLMLQAGVSQLFQHMRFEICILTELLTRQSLHAYTYTKKYMSDMYV